MDVGAPLATVPVSFFDHRTGLSALAIQHVRADGRIALVYHDAPGVAAARPLLAGVAETLMADLVAGQTLSLIETSMPEHEAEPFVYARVTLSFAAWPGRVSADTERVITADAVAHACGYRRARIGTHRDARPVHPPGALVRVPRVPSARTG